MPLYEGTCQMCQDPNCPTPTEVVEEALPQKPTIEVMDAAQLLDHLNSLDEL